ncbi:MAG: hypothetical protein FJX75_07600 [Armatimonadetes bacterium]|nr:hypothetical protein [Armatimonadota bacterium]
MHSRSRLTILCCVTALALASLGFASPSIFGPNGLLLTPTADTPGMADVQLGAWWAGDLANSVALTSGEGSGFESTAAWVDLNGAGSEEVFSGKWRFRNNSFTQPAFAVGLIDITNQLDRTPYVVVQKGFHLSGNGLMAMVGYAQPDSLLDGFFAGGELTLADKYKAIAEYDGDDVNGAIRFSLGKHIEITAGMVKDEFAASAMFKLK